MEITSNTPKEINNEFAIAITEQISAMLGYWDKDLICRFANTAYLDWFGKSREEMVNKLTLRELLGEDLYAKNEPYIIGVLQGIPQQFEREIITPREKRYSLANYFPNFSHGIVKGFFVHVADVTPIKLLEKELIESNKKIKDQNKRLLNFANIVTHNLKNFANNLGVVLELFIESDSYDVKAEMLNFLKEISMGFSSTIMHLTEIVDIQNLSTIKKEQVVLNDFIQQSIRTLMVEINSTYTIILNNVPPAIKVLYNRAYLESIITNLLSNAIKYRDPERLPKIFIEATETEKEVILSIQDNGMGIDLNRYKEKLFGMYNTFHSHVDAKGIGLFLVKSQIDAMDGNIEVESEIGVGTTFKVFIKK